ncbi:MAG: hypothetical protein MUF21_09025 [Gemmatimonadaceae bacterium]|nr:hypothetical protein [Gemmatimonadaceae bacterium]
MPILAVLALAATAAAPRAAAAQEGDGETFLCRGPFAIGIEQGTERGELQPSASWWVVDFDPATGAVGARGERLRPGTCGFAERALLEDEPNRISFLRTRPPSLRIGDREDLPQSHPGTVATRNQIGTWLERCSGDSSCVLRVQAKADQTPSRLGFEGGGPVSLLTAARVAAGRAPAVRPSIAPRRDSLPVLRPASNTKPVIRRTT